MYHVGKRKELEMFDFTDKLRNIPDLTRNFSIKLGENNIVITYTTDGKLIITKQNNESECVVVDFDFKDDNLELSSLLNEVPENDKCRTIKDSKPGKYYIDLILSIIKTLLNKYGLNFKHIKIADVATVNSSLINLNGNDEELTLSVLKLLLEGRMYYEAYGFLPLPSPLKLDENGIDYEKLELYIKSRHYLLNTPINALLESIINYPHVLEEVQTKRTIIVESLTNICEFIKSNDATLLLHSLSAIFKRYVKFKQNDELLRKICRDIYLLLHKYILVLIPFICETLYETLYKTEYKTEYEQCIRYTWFYYIITSDTEHYDKVAAIYAKYGISRYENYCNYLHYPVILSGGYKYKSLTSNTQKYPRLKLYKRTIKQPLTKKIKLLKHKTYKHNKNTTKNNLIR